MKKKYTLNTHYVLQSTFMIFLKMIFMKKTEVKYKFHFYRVVELRHRKIELFAWGQIASSLKS